MIFLASSDNALTTGALVPVYSTTEGLPQRALRSLMWRLVEAFAGDVPETLPMVAVDPGLLERSVANLVENGLVHGPPGHRRQQGRARARRANHRT